MKYIGIMLFCLASLGVKAQDLNSVNFNLFSGNQQIIHDATKDGLVIVSQSYQLEDTVTHQKFGRYGKPEFGQGYSVGVKISGKLILRTLILSVIRNLICRLDIKEQFVNVVIL